MKKLFLTYTALGSLLFSFPASSMEDVKEQQKTSQKILLLQEQTGKFIKAENNFYLGKIKDRPLWIVMEQVSKDTLNDWKSYATGQTNSRKIDYACAIFLKNNPKKTDFFKPEGSNHFKLVFDDVDIHTNEVWVAYVTSNKEPEPKKVIWEDLIMFVSVTSSPHALITSHMGVSYSLEGLKNEQWDKFKGISMDLHSFAAKVMILRNPNRKWMINAPARVMEKIMATNMPSNSIFVGTRERKKLAEQRSNATKEEFLQSESKSLTYTQECMQKKHKGLLNTFKESKEHYEQFIQRTPTLEELNDLRDYDGLEEGEDFKKFLSKILEEIDEQIKKESEKFELLYSQLIDKKFSQWKQQFSEINLRENGDSHPILSVDDNKLGIRAQQKLIIYDRDNQDKEWLSINKDDSNYDWIFTRPFEPSGSTHFIAVDLLELANLKSLDSSK